MRHCLVLSTHPDAEAAKSLAETLVNEQLAACVNVLPGLLSVYLWQGSLESSPEALLLIKTTGEAYPRLEARLRELHPYELPEIVAIDIERGLPDYLNWVGQCVKPL